MNSSILPPPTLEPILYFFTHSLLVIASAAVLFFLLGLWFGWLTWARHKRRARAFQEETTLLRHEIATLKRRIAEESVDAAPMMPIGDDAHALMDHEAPPQMTLVKPAAEPAPASLAAAMQMSIPSSPVMKAVTGAMPQMNGTTTADSAATASHQVPMVVPDAKPVAAVASVPPIVQPATPKTASVPLPEPKTESTTIVLPSPGRETASVPLPPTGRSMTGPISLPMLPELTEVPSSNGAVAGHAFAAELASGTVRVDENLGVLYAVKPDRWDDLTLLRGVADVLQTRLHECGIYTFKQIGTWTEDNIRDVAQRIQAKERIQRDHWVQQARELHYLKYGEKLGE